MKDFPWAFQASGDAALLVTIAKTIEPAANQFIHGLTRSLDDHLMDGITGVVPAYGSLLIHYDPLMTDLTAVIQWVKATSDRVIHEQDSLGRIVEIPVYYGGEDGPDLNEVARHCKMTPRQVVQIHTKNMYRVFMMGFAPGFPYLGGMDPSIAAPRLDNPRQRVPAGSVGIAGLQTGIYSIDSPGGWRIIGRTPLRLFDIHSDPVFLLSPGDTIRFIPLPREDENDVL